VLARYGGNFRGLKVSKGRGSCPLTVVYRALQVKRAQELGAAGVLIYSDPRDDGTVTPQNGYSP